MFYIKLVQAFINEQRNMGPIIEPGTVYSFVTQIKTKGLCGTLHVYENHETKTGKKIPIKVIVFPAEIIDPPKSAFAYHWGGNGASADEASDVTDPDSASVPESDVQAPLSGPAAVRRIAQLRSEGEGLSRNYGEQLYSVKVPGWPGDIPKYGDFREPYEKYEYDLQSLDDTRAQIRILYDQLSQEVTAEEAEASRVSSRSAEYRDAAIAAARERAKFVPLIYGITGMSFALLIGGGAWLTFKGYGPTIGDYTIFILGDLFEAWIGDDVLDSMHRNVNESPEDTKNSNQFLSNIIQQLKALAAQTPTYLS